MRFLYALIALGLICGSAVADELNPEQQALVTKLRTIKSSLHPETGDIKIPSANVTIHLGDEYYFLPPDEARNVLVNAWNNPASAANGELGMIFPKGSNFWDEKGWAAVVTFEPSGFISNSQYSQSDFDDAAKAMRDTEDASNEARKKAGAVPIHFVGWAQPPQYDQQNHTVIWARDLHFGAADVDTLNYDVRVLGRRGYLSLNMVSEMPELETIRQDAQELRARAEYEPGSRYEDFNMATDKKSALGIAGLVAAGAGVVLAQKLGLFAAAALFLKKAVVLVIAALAALAGWVRNLFSRKEKIAQNRPTDAPPRYPQPPPPGAPES
jgi:uncharacterized membrane-anchored protein